MEHDLTLPDSAARRPRSSTEAKYRDAMALYRSTSLSVKRICELTRINAAGFRTYVQRYQREAMHARYGTPDIGRRAAATRLRTPHGQTRAAAEKYREAIRACENRDLLGYTISQIARRFRLDPTALANQLRAHFPEILERRERERRLLGIQDNLQRGVRPQSRQRYARAVEQLWSTDKTIVEVAHEAGVSVSGLHEHLLFYHKPLIRHRADRRLRACAQKIPGAMTGNGTPHRPTPAIVEKYREAVGLYASTALPLRKIATATGVSVEGLRKHLHMWHKELILARRGVPAAGAGVDAGAELARTKRYSKAASEKYAAAIAELRRSEGSTADIAARYGLHPECFRSYLREHEPELFARKGMTRRADGRLVSRRSEEKYREAIRLYESTTETLKSIARRLGLSYNSVGGFVRRNCPEVIARHNALVRAGR